MASTSAGQSNKKTRSTPNIILDFVVMKQGLDSHGRETIKNNRWWKGSWISYNESLNNVKIEVQHDNHSAPYQAFVQVSLSSDQLYFLWGLQLMALNPVLIK